MSARKIKRVRTKGRDLYKEITPIKPFVAGDTDEERFKNAASMVYRGWEQRKSK